MQIVCQVTASKRLELRGMHGRPGGGLNLYSLSKARPLEREICASTKWMFFL
jgi:hypothetical protein